MPSVITVAHWPGPPNSWKWGSSAVLLLAISAFASWQEVGVSVFVRR